MPDFGLFRGFGDKLVAGQTPVNLGAIGSLSVLDPDVNSFFNRVASAGGTLTSTEQSSIISLVAQMKLDGTWSAMKAVYPMVGSSAAACSQNLISASYTGTFSSGWTYTSTGVTPNGTSAFMNTGFLPSTQLTSITNAHLSIYSRTNNINFGYDMGCSTSGYFNILAIGIKLDSSNGAFFINDLNPLFSPITNSLGLTTISRINNTEIKIKRNSDAATTITKSTIAIPAFNIYIGALNLGGTADRFNNREYSFASIGDGLTDTQSSNFYTAVQAFQTSLSRQV